MSLREWLLHLFDWLSRLPQIGRHWWSSEIDSDVWTCLVCGRQHIGELPDD